MIPYHNWKLMLILSIKKVTNNVSKRARKESRKQERSILPLKPEEDERQPKSKNRSVSIWSPINGLMLQTKRTKHRSVDTLYHGNGSTRYSVEYVSVLIDMILFPVDMTDSCDLQGKSRQRSFIERNSPGLSWQLLLKASCSCSKCRMAG